MALAIPSRVPLRGDVDIERLIRAVPAGHTMKGAFVASSAALLATEWPTLQALLISPPREAKYHVFHDYPLADYLRLTDAAARKKFPKVPGREAHRLLARSTFDIFGQTPLGRVMVSLLSGPASALLKYQEAYNRLVNGSRVEVKVVEPRLVEARFTSYFSVTEAIYGVLEGIVMACNGDPTVTIEMKEPGHFVAIVAWENLAAS
jgi:uncharacterized protein (TIGR02265 family)